MSDGRSTAVRGTVDGGGGTVSISPNGLPVVGLTISGPFVQTLAIEELIDGADPTAAQVFTAAGVAASATISAPGRYLVASAGRSSIQVRQTAYTSGTATIVMYATMGAAGSPGGQGASQGSWIDRSGTIGGVDTSQLLLAVNPVRRAWFIQNLDATEALWVNFGVDAVQDTPSIKIIAGFSYEEKTPGVVSTQDVRVIAHTIGHKFTAKEM